MITVKNILNAPIKKVWEYWTKEEHVKNWNFATSDWHCPNATNNLQVGGEFHYTMSARTIPLVLISGGLIKKLNWRNQ